MNLPDLELPPRTKLDFGIGLDAASLAPRNRVVSGEPTTVEQAGGVASQRFDVSRITSSRELETKLAINASASYGAPFGAGVSARFGFSQDVSVQSSSLFMAITCTIRLAGLSIEAPVLVPEAAALTDRPDVFLARYGNMFVHACDRGGLFVGILQIDAKDETEASKISTELKGTYGLFSAEASTNFSSIQKKHDASVYCSMYSEGGPRFDTLRPDDPGALLEYANAWFTAMHDDPNKYSTPYTWYLSPIAVASGPVPPNAADIAHAQDVLAYCGTERLDCLDQLNLLNQLVDNPARFDWTGPVTREAIAAAARAAQSDLDIIAKCASHAMNNVAQATMPSAYAAGVGKTYPSLLMPEPLPPLNRGAEASLEAAGQAIARSDTLVAAVRAAIPDGPQRKGFDIGMGTWAGDTLPGPGKTAAANVLPADQRTGYDVAALFSLAWNNNAEAAARGQSVVTKDPAAGSARDMLPVGMSWLGFNIATGIFGPPALGGAGNTLKGPGSGAIRNALDVEIQRGFDAAVAHWRPGGSY